MIVDPEPVSPDMSFAETDIESGDSANVVLFA